MDEVAAWFLWLHKTTGIKLTIFYDGYDRARFVEGFVTTMALISAPPDSFQCGRSILE